MIFLPSGSEMKALDLVVMMSILWCYLIPVMTSPSLALHNTNNFLPTLTDRQTRVYIPSPAPCAVCLPAAACWGSCWQKEDSRQTCHWSAAEIWSSWASASWCASWGLRVPHTSHSALDLNFLSTHEQCRAGRNIAAPRTPRIFIWKSWKIFIH